MYPTISLEKPWQSALLALVLGSLMYSGIALPGEHNTRRFDASKVCLEDVSVQVTIDVREQDIVSVTINGPDRMRNAVSLQVADGCLIVRQSAAASIGEVSVLTLGNGPGNSRSVIAINGVTAVVGGNGVVVANSAPTEATSIEVTIPPGTPLQMRRFSGKATIGDLKAPFSFTGSGKVEAGELTDMSIEVTRNGKFQAAKVSGQLKINASGNSRVGFTTGYVDQLHADLQGNSRVKYAGHAHQAKVSVTDNARLFIASLDTRQETHVTRNGHLTIGNW